MLGKFLSQPHTPTFFEIFSRIPLSASLQVGSLTKTRASNIIKEKELELSIKEQEINDYAAIAYEHGLILAKREEDIANVEKDLGLGLSRENEALRKELKSLRAEPTISSDKKKLLTSSEIEEIESEPGKYAGEFKLSEQQKSSRHTLDLLARKKNVLNLSIADYESIKYPFIEIKYANNGELDSFKITDYNGLGHKSKMMYVKGSEAHKHSDKTVHKVSNKMLVKSLDRLNVSDRAYNIILNLAKKSK